MSKHQVCHVEWDVTDLSRARDFYEGLFEWEFREFGEEMVVFGTGDSHIGGLMKTQTVKTGKSPSIWIEVESIDAMLEKAKTLGGSVFQEKSEIPTVGWSGQIEDPDGNYVGIVQFAQK